MPRIAIPDFRYAHPNGDVKVFVGAKRVTFNGSRLSVSSLLEYLPDNFRISNPGEEYREISREQESDGPYRVLVDPIIVTAGTPVSGYQEGLGSYAIENLPPGTVQENKTTKNDLVLSGTQFRRDGKTAVLETGNARQVDYQPELIRFDPEYLSGIDGMPDRDDGKQRMLLLVKPGINPVAINRCPRLRNGSFVYDMDVNSGFSETPSIYNSSPQHLRLVVDNHNSPAELLQQLTEKRELSVGYAASERRPERKLNTELMKALLQTRSFTYVAFSDNRGFVIHPEEDGEDLFLTLLKHGTLEKVYVIE